MLYFRIKTFQCHNIMTFRLPNTGLLPGHSDHCPVCAWHRVNLRMYLKISASGGSVQCIVFVGDRFFIVDRSNASWYNNRKKLFYISAFWRKNCVMILQNYSWKYGNNYVWEIDFGTNETIIEKRNLQ